VIQLRLQDGYCIDTNALIDIHNHYYPPDIFPGLWKDIEELVNQGVLIAPGEVFSEICAKDDGLAKWVIAKKSKMIIALDTDQIQIVQSIVKNFPGLIDYNRTIPDADPFVIALAKCRSWSVITSEKPSNSIVKPKIPNVCKSLNVKCIKILDFFRESGLIYVR